MQLSRTAFIGLHGPNEVHRPLRSGCRTNADQGSHLWKSPLRSTLPVVVSGRQPVGDRRGAVKRTRVDSDADLGEPHGHSAPGGSKGAPVPSPSMNRTQKRILDRSLDQTTPPPVPRRRRRRRSRSLERLVADFFPTTGPPAPAEAQNLPALGHRRDAQGTHQVGIHRKTPKPTLRATALGPPSGLLFERCAHGEVLTEEA